LVLFWYGLVPIAGALASRHTWRRFRRHFDRLRLAPLLDYTSYVSCGRTPTAPKLFRFTGSFESITGGHTLWVRSSNLTIPVVLAGAQVYMLPMEEKDGGRDTLAEEAPQRLNWDQVATLTGEVRVFVGGALSLRDGRWIFAVTPETPLQVIFYTGPNRSMAIRVIRAGRHRNEYWNNVTPYALVLGALCLIGMAITFLPRPAFRLTVITAFLAAFVPLYTLVPPGLLLTIAYRRLWQGARVYRSFRDLARLPLVYSSGRLPNGESYGARCYRDLPEGIPQLVPGMKKSRKEQWHVFGVLDPAVPPPACRSSGSRNGGSRNSSSPEVPREPEDSFATFGAIPGDPEKLARGYTRRAYVLEILSWLLLLGGIGLNALFVWRIITLFYAQI
jgi:hypothetical protein